MNVEINNGIEQRGEGYFVQDPETGEWLELRGYGSLKVGLDLDPRIDLTKPIYEQVLILEKADRVRQARRKLSAKKTAAPA